MELEREANKSQYDLSLVSKFQIFFFHGWALCFKCLRSSSLEVNPKTKEKENENALCTII